MGILVPRGKRIIVVGHGRSGTGYIARLLQAHGYEVGHESWGKDGSADWKLTGTYVRQANDFIIHVVRHPVKVVSSSLFTFWFNAFARMRMRLEMVGRSPMLGIAMACYVGWNRLAETLKPDVRVNIEKVREQLKFDCKAIKPLPPKDCNSRPHPKIQLAYFRQRRDIWGEFSKIMKEYGYDEED